MRVVKRNEEVSGDCAGGADCDDDEVTGDKWWWVEGDGKFYTHLLQHFYLLLMKMIKVKSGDTGDRDTSDLTRADERGDCAGGDAFAWWPCPQSALKASRTLLFLQRLLLLSFSGKVVSGGGGQSPPS